jgi:hypothetical protein
MICCSCNTEDNVKNYELLTLLWTDRGELGPTGFMDIPLCFSCRDKLEIELVLTPLEDRMKKRIDDHFETRISTPMRVFDWGSCWSEDKEIEE